ncbi:hypothetical protein T439DRAFT_151435 [Meredithblackwellia eburnea MCA 4105]
MSTTIGSIPAVPAGENPYKIYNDALKGLVYLVPSPGFKPRLIVLFAVLGAALLVSVFNIALSIEEARRKQVNPFWCFRLVERHSGRFIVTNTKFISSVLSVTNLVLFIIYINDCWLVYISNQPPSHTAGWRALPTFFVVFQGWLVSWGLLQAYLLTPERSGQKYLTATVANSLFVAGGLVLGAAVLATAILNLLAGKELFRQFESLSAVLVSLESQWTGTETDLTSLLKLAPMLKSINKASTDYQRAMGVEFGMAAGVACTICLINLGSILLFRVLRQQIASKADRILQTTDLNTSMSAQHFSPEIDDHVVMSPRMDGVGERRPSRKEIREIARRPSGTEVEAARQLVLLQKAEVDLFYMTVALILICALCAGLCLNIAIQARGTTLLTNWTQLEFCLTGVQWMFGVSLIISFTAVNINGLRNLDELTRSTDVPTDMRFSGTTTVFTLRGFFAAGVRGDDGGGGGGLEQGEGGPGVVQENPLTFPGAPLRTPLTVDDSISSLLSVEPEKQNPIPCSSTLV